MMKVTLNGDWKVSGSTYKELPARVPGCIHTDLMDNQLMEDPFYRDNELKYMYIGQRDWTYERTFVVSDELLAFDEVKLTCKGLDTFATIYINDGQVARTDNMFRTWEFDVKSYLSLGNNHIRIELASTFPYIEKELERRYLHITGIDDHRILGSNYVRKSQCNYGWDWGPMCVTAGIWRDIDLTGYNMRLTNTQIKQYHSQDHVNLEVITGLEGQYEGLDLRVNVLYDGQKVTSKEVTLGQLDVTLAGPVALGADESVDQVDLVLGSRIAVTLDIDQPKLWWPNNLGDQNLYQVEVSLLKGEKVIQVLKETVGLRSLVLDRHPDQYGETFQFVVNGNPFFAKGANWIPIDTFVTRGSEDFYRDILTSAKEANMNFIRVWGGGIYEQDIFYNLCDELGLCVWQDFMFACSAYPVDNQAYMETLAKEVKDNVIRLRNHACLALWCGNNEIEYIDGFVTDDGKNGSFTWKEYLYLYDEFIPNIMNAFDGQTDYWASSPMDGKGDLRGDGKSPERGDAHLWDVWHGLKPFEWYRTCDHRFNSEFGFQSFPEPEVVKGYTEEEDRNISSYVMEHHQRSGIGNSTIIHYMLSWFKLPNDFDMLMWTSQILQSLAIKYAGENWRRKMPRGMGSIYWQLNDVWPGPSWSSIDSFGNWKALNYTAKKFFNPVLISGIENRKDHSIELFLSNDTLEEKKGLIKWRAFNFNGQLLKSGSLMAMVGPNTSKSLGKLAFNTLMNEKDTEREVVVTYAYEVDGQVLSCNTTYFMYPKHLIFQQPAFDLTCYQVDERTFDLTIESNKPALWVWMEVEEEKARYSDRFFDLFPGDVKEVRVRLEEKLSINEFTKKLRVSSVYDIYQ